MATRTTNYGLWKPADADMASQDKFNDNMDILDGVLGELAVRVVYGTTTSNDIETAYQANKMVYCIYNGYMYILMSRVSAISHVFTAFRGKTRHYIQCNNNVWEGGSYEFATVAEIEAALALKANAADMTTALAGKLDKSGGTMTGALSMNTHKITGVVNGTSSKDAVNKGQLDEKLDLSGGTMTGNIAMGTNKITGLANGTSNKDAVNKEQLDSAAASRLGLPKAYKYVDLMYESGTALVTVLFNSALGHTVDPDRTIAVPLKSGITVNIVAERATFTRNSTSGSLNTGAIILEYN